MNPDGAGDPDPMRAKLPGGMADSHATVTSIPERVGRYEVVLPIASGGMATVYLARLAGGRGFSRQVALKLTHAHLRDNPEFTTDLLEEAKLASGVRHPNVVPVLEVDEDPLGMYLIMEYVEGETLGGLRRRAALARRPLPPAVGLRILLDALAGLHAAHELRDERGELVNLVHRDFSPQNILVGVDGTSRLTDFGIAKASSRLGHTRQGLVKGKISYMAPEQARSLPLDRRCDVWAAGVIAWELFAQRRLHPGGDGDVGTLLKVVSEPPALLRTIDPNVPEEIEHIVHEALIIDREHRTDSALSCSRDLMTAARRCGMLADHAQVAAFLSEIAGAKLAERRGRAGEVLRLRARMGAPGSSKENDERLAQDIRDAIRPLAEMLEPESDSDIEAAIGPLLPDTRVAPLLSMTDGDELEDVRLPGPLEGTTGAAASVTFPNEEGPTKRRRRPSVKGSPWLLGGAGVALLVLGVALGATLSRRAPPPAPVLGAAVAPGPTPLVPTSAAVPPSEKASATPPSGPIAATTTAPPQAGAEAGAGAEEPRLAPGTLIVHAHVAVAELDVDGRPVRLAIATKEPLLELAPEERARTIRLTARSADGRESTLVVLPGVEEIAIEFAAKPKPPRPSPRLRH